jgi:uncharacterized circularly permuted ATP-grasp superfamily protein/uncharacterized alpha-E superfamily protein
MPLSAVPQSRPAAPTAPLVSEEDPLRVPGYQAEKGVFDEMVDAEGRLRPHWHTFGSFLRQCSSADFTARSEAIQSLLRDHGVTYNIYDDALGTSRPWSLDLLPFIIAQDDFAEVQRGLDQRGRLLNAILQDLYGPQKLLKDGLIPPSLIHANPGFLRPVLGINPPGGKFVFSFGCDMVRSDSGQWMVLADRAQAPSGHGYALENRIIMANVHAEEFNASKIRRLASYYEMKREMLRSLAPKHRRGEAGILMLTPGPYNETYFEHAFQARYLGFPLVEGGDLTVRDRHVHLKTLEGLRRVDVVIRHLDDVYCDPLELNPGSLLGVAGLLESWRNGSIALANGLGTGLIETPALHPFMPNLCRYLLGEELRLSCVPTWWCGQRRELDMVLADPDRWVVKPAFVRGARDPVFMADLDAEQKARMIDTIRGAPHEWVAQEVLQLSTTPTWTGGGKIEPRSLVWRAFAIAQGSGFATMPGGLSRVSPEPHRWLVTMRSGGISKDTWIVGDGKPDPYYEKLRQQQPVVIRPARPPSGVPSRVADHLFWLGRYAERLEASVRVLRAVMQRLSGERSRLQGHEAEGCMALMAHLGLVPEGTTDLAEHLPALLRDPKRNGGVPDLLGRLRYNAAAARDRLSDDMWRLFNRLDRDARLPASPFLHTTAQGMLDTLVLDLAAFSGMQQENMTRGHGWRFLEIGKRIERACIVLGLVGTATKYSQKDDFLLTPLLEICDSSMTYRRLHFARPSLVPVLDLLLLNDSNPRSAAHQFQILGRLTAQLPQAPGIDLEITPRHLTDGLQSDLLGINLAAIAKTEAGVTDAIPSISEKIAVNLEKLSDLITEHFFSHASRKVEET